MPTLTLRQREKVLLGVRTTCCDGTVETYGLQDVSVETIQYRDTARRVRPSILITSPTVQGIASRTLKQPAISCYEITSRCGSPPNCAMNRRVYVRRYISPPTPSMGLPPVPTSEINARIFQEIQKEQVRAHRSVAQVDKAAKTIYSVIKIAGKGIDCSLGGKRSCYKLWQDFLWAMRNSVECLLPKNIFRCWANFQLAVNFGLKPLARTLKDIAEELGSGSAKRFRHISFSIKAPEKVMMVDGWQFTQKVKYSCSAYILMDSTVTGDFHLGTFEEWAWERIPFSFVVDWMIPVGEYIAAKSTLSEIGGFFGTIRTVNEISGSRLEPIQDPQAQRVWLESGGSFRYKSHTRGLLSKPTLPDMLQWKPTNSLNSLSNAIALLVQLRAGRTGGTRSPLPWKIIVPKLKSAYTKVQKLRYKDQLSSNKTTTKSPITRKTL